MINTKYWVRWEGDVISKALLETPETLHVSCSLKPMTSAWLFGTGGLLKSIPSTAHMHQSHTFENIMFHNLKGGEFVPFNASFSLSSHLLE